MSGLFRIGLKLNSIAVIAGFVGLVSVGAEAQAQGAGVSGGNALEEMVVTARRREESLQDTPLSITAFSGDMLQQRLACRSAQLPLQEGH